MSRITTDQILQITLPTRAASDEGRTGSNGSERFEKHLQQAAAEPEKAATINRHRNEVRAADYDDAGGNPDAAPSDDQNTGLLPEPADEGDAPLDKPLEYEPPDDGDKVTISGSEKPDNEIIDAIVYTKAVPGEDEVLQGEKELTQVGDIAADQLHGEEDNDTSQQGTPDTTLDGELVNEVAPPGDPEATAVEPEATAVEPEATAVEPEATAVEPEATAVEGEPADEGIESLGEDSELGTEKTRDGQHDAAKRASSTEPQTRSNPSTQSNDNAIDEVDDAANGKVADKQPPTADAQSTETTEAISAPTKSESRAEHHDQPTSHEQRGEPAITSKADEPAATKPATENVAPTADAETNAKTNATTSAASTVDAAVGSGRPLSPSAANSDADVASNRAEAASTPTVDRARFVRRVSGALRAAHQRDGQIQLRLSPPELGSLRIEIVVKQGVVTATLETETAAARNLLLDNLPALRQRLAEQEIRIEKFDVDVRRDGQGQPDNPDTEDRQPDRPQPNRAPRPDDSPEQSIASTAAAPPISPHNGALDVRI